MVIAGVGGHAREVYDILDPATQSKVLLFEEFETKQYNNWRIPVKICRDYNDLREVFRRDPSFVVAVGDPKLRRQFYQKMVDCGGKPVSAICSSALISKVNVTMGDGLNIMSFAFISSNVTIGTGTLINAGTRIHHDCTIGEFCQISPNVTFTGNCVVGNNTTIGTSATILPGVKIGSNVTVAAGSVVIKDVEDGQTVMGVPAKARQNAG